MTKTSREPCTIVSAANGLIFAALVLPLCTSTVPAFAGPNIQMLPPVNESTTTPCTAGTTHMLTWDGSTPIACSSELTVSGNFVGIGTNPENTGVDTAPANLGIPPNAAVLDVNGDIVTETGHIVSNYKGNQSIAGSLALDAGPWEGINTTPGTGIYFRSDNVLGKPGYVAGGAYRDLMFVRADGNVGIGTTSPQVMLDVQGGEIRPGDSNVACTSTNAGAIRYDAAAGQVEYCDSSSNIWRSFSKPKLTPTESIFCQEGIGAAGASPLCTYIGTNGGTAEYTATTTSSHDLCVLSLAAGYAGGLWGECQISGTPGSTWQLFLAAYKQVSCTITCYDFQ